VSGGLDFSARTKVLALSLASAVLSLAWILWDVAFISSLWERKDFLYLVTIFLAVYLSAPSALIGVGILGVRKPKPIYLFHVLFFTSIYYRLLQYTLDFEDALFASIPIDEPVSILGDFADPSIWILCIHCVMAVANAAIIFFAYRKLGRVPDAT